MTFILTFLLFPHSKPAQLYPLSLHDALPILIDLLEVAESVEAGEIGLQGAQVEGRARPGPDPPLEAPPVDRKSTRLNSSHITISYAVFCLKKKITNFSNTGFEVFRCPDSSQL